MSAGFCDFAVTRSINRSMFLCQRTISVITVITVRYYELSTDGAFTVITVRYCELSTDELFTVS
jgi:hypothetical protein